MAERVGVSGLVLAVEGHPKLARGLVKRARKRRLSQVEVIGKALHDRIGRVPFHCAKEHPAYSGIEARRYDFPEMVHVDEVEAITIDALISAHPRRRLRICKLDLEGGELRALQGGIATLRSSRPLIVFENDRENSARDYRYSKEEWFDFFAAAKYEVFTLWGSAFRSDDWSRRNIPWYFIAAAADSADSTFVEQELPVLLQRYAPRR
jgi:FkbM family methyltransferase